MDFVGSSATILCCVCGTPIQANAANTCAQCLQSRHDITENVTRNGILCRCKGCDRWQKDTVGWVGCELESRELLALCLRKTKGLKTVRLVDAAFIWTEEHSRRVKVKIKVQKEVMNSVILQESLIVEFVVRNRMCEDCHRTEANQTWNSVVQVRQKVDHKRTFLYLEQAIIKHDAYDRTVAIKPQPDGVDFYFSARNHAVRFVDFLESVVPVRCFSSKKIVSLDTKSNIALHNHTFAAELVPICKDDLVCLPKAVAGRCGTIAQLVLCITVGSSLRFIDPLSCQICETTSQRYWMEPYRQLAQAKALEEFIVLDVTAIDNSPSAPASEAAAAHAPKSRKGKRRRGDGGRMPRSISRRHRLAEVEVARTADFGVNDARFTVITHLGHLLKPGDSALGYLVAGRNFNDDNLDALERSGYELPDVVLVRKHYPRWRSRPRERQWKLRAIAADAPDKPGVGVGVALHSEEGRRDVEMFMRDIEEDSELRAGVNLYKRSSGGRGADSAAARGSAATAVGAAAMAPATGDTEEEEDVEEDVPLVPIDELLDDLVLDDADAAPDDEDDDL